MWGRRGRLERRAGKQTRSVGRKRHRVTRTLGGECGDAARIGIQGGVREDVGKDEESSGVTTAEGVGMGRRGSRWRLVAL